MQHLEPMEYRQFKSDQLANIMRSLGIENSVLAPMVEVGGHSRRRVEFKVAVRKKEIRIGFFAKRTLDVVALEECWTSKAALVSLLPALKACLESLKKPGLIKAVSLTVLEAGLDVIITTLKPLKENDQEKLVGFAEAEGFSRLSVQSAGEGFHCLHDTQKSTIKFGGIELNLPIGAFLQATAEGESAITRFVLQHLQDCKNVADLYAGCGTYSFPLVQNIKSVSSYEGSEELSQAMYNAAVNSNLMPQLTTSTRDLFKRPLRPQELDCFDGIVINPPRNGALPQIRNIAKSNVAKVVMVYCNPSTFKRDLSHLIDSGYKVISAQAIDQFIWSDHLETVAYLKR